MESIVGKAGEEEVSLLASITQEIVSKHDETDGEEGTDVHLPIDQVMEMSGSMTRIQLFFFIFFEFISTIVGWHMLSPVFMGDSPAWTCTTVNNSNQFCQQNAGILIEKTNVNYSKRCEMQRKEWEYSKGDAYSYVTEFDLVCGRSYISDLIGSALFIGGILPAIISGTLSDSYGRKKTFLFSFLIVISCCMGMCFVNNVWALFTLRVLLGFGYYAVYSVGYVYMAEVIPPKRRSLLVNLLNFPSDPLSLVAFAYLVQTWRDLQLYISVPGFLALIGFIFVPKSPYWLMSAGKHDQAEQVVREIAHLNGKVLSKDIRLKVSRDIATSGRKYTYLDLFRKLKVATLCTATLFLSFSFALCYYTTTFNVGNLGGDIYISFLFVTLPDIPSTFLPYYMCDRFGRRPTILLNCAISGIFQAIIALVTWQFSTVYILNVILSFCGKLSLSTAFNASYLWQMELYPTVVRSQGACMCVVAEGLGAAAAPFMSSVLHNMHPALPYLVMAVFAVLASLFGLVLPETKGEPTRENYEEF